MITPLTKEIIQSVRCLKQEGEIGRLERRATGKVSEHIRTKDLLSSRSRDQTRFTFALLLSAANFLWWAGYFRKFAKIYEQAGAREMQAACGLWQWREIIFLSHRQRAEASLWLAAQIACEYTRRKIDKILLIGCAHQKFFAPFSGFHLSWSKQLIFIVTPFLHITEHPSISRCRLVCFHFFLKCHKN